MNSQAYKIATKLAALILISVLFTSCLKDIFEDAGGDETDLPVLIRAKINGVDFEGYRSSAELQHFSDDSYKFSIGISDAKTLGDIFDFNEVALIFKARSFSDIKVGNKFSENYSTSDSAEVADDFLFTGGYLEGGVDGFDVESDSHQEGGSGQLIITALDTTNKIISGTFYFTAPSRWNDAVYVVTDGVFTDIEYELD